MPEDRNNAEDAHPEELPARKLSGRRLSEDEAAEMAAQVSRLAEAGLPLGEGLRALAEDGSSRKLRGVLLELAERIESGMPLDEAIEAQSDVLPKGLRGLVIAGVRDGRLAEVLEQYAACQRERSQLRRRLCQVFAYPVVLLLSLSAVFVLLDIVAVPIILEVAGDMYSDFEPDGERNLSLLEGVASLGSWLWKIMLLAAVLGVVLSFFRRRDAWVARVVLAVPLIGPLIRWNRTFHLSRMVALLLKLGVPLPEVFRMAADGTDDAYLRSGCRRVADEVAAGGELSRSMASKRQFPPSMVALVSWGEGANSLDEAFSAASESLQERAKAQLAFMEATLPPLVFLVVATMLCAWMSALYFGLSWTVVRGLVDWGFTRDSGNAEHFAAILQNMPFMAVFGIAVLWSMRLIGGRTEPGDNDPVRLAIRITGWVLVAAAGTGFIVPVIIVMKTAVLIPCTVAAIVLAATHFGRREAQRKALLGLLATATRRFMPLTPVLEAFASERRGFFGRRARRLVRQLETGVPLPEALASGKKLFPRKSQALIHLGSETDLLSAALQRATSTSDQGENARRVLIGKSLCMLWMLSFVGSVLGFFASRIVPQFVTIFEEFDAELPSVAAAFIQFCQIFGPWITFVWFLLGIIFLYGTARYVGLIHWDLPGISRFVRRLDTAAILDAMSLAVEHGKPLPAVVESLSRGYPKWSIRRRLAKVRVDLLQGVDWCESLLARRLIKRADFAVLRAAVEAGNLPWAMRELAESSRRRFNYRLDVLLQFVVPTLVCATSLFVGFAALFVLMPLVQLIQALV